MKLTFTDSIIDIYMTFCKLMCCKMFSFIHSFAIVTRQLIKSLQKCNVQKIQKEISEKCKIINTSSNYFYVARTHV